LSQYKKEKVTENNNTTIEILGSFQKINGEKINEDEEPKLLKR
jgi:hypothetical protein